MEATEDTLCARDNRGCTPLHLAVEYERCTTDSQFDIVKALIENGDSALEKFTTVPNHYSAYQYHEYTRGKAQRSRTERKSVEYSEDGG
jgi:hypothetical protein